MNFNQQEVDRRLINTLSFEKGQDLFFVRTIVQSKNVCFLVLIPKYVQINIFENLIRTFTLIFIMIQRYDKFFDWRLYNLRFMMVSNYEAHQVLKEFI